MSKIILSFFVISSVFIYPVEAQQRTDTALKSKLIRMYTWKMKEVRNKGYMLYLDFPYNLGSHSRKPDQYISMAADFKYDVRDPVFITFTLPDDVDSARGLLVGFNNEPLSSSSFSLDKLKEVYKVPFVKHWYNNHTIMASLRNGMLIDTIKGKKTNIFGKLMYYSDFYVLFYDSIGLRKMYFPLSFFQRRYKELSISSPTYSTGNPNDTALTVEERTDKKVFGITNIPGSWQMAGISDPIRLKHFIKYFRYLMDHNEKGKMAQLIVFPQEGVIPKCNDSADFVHHYNQIFDEDLKRIINNQKLDQLFRNIHGVMMGFVPCIWIREQGNKYVISYIANNLLDKEMEKANERYEKKKKQQAENN